MSEPKASLLVVDDEPSIRESIQRALEQSGYAVATAGDANSAAAWLARSAVDLVLCDVRLPGMSGLDLLPRIRDRHPDARVVVITGHASIRSAVEAIRQGASDYLPKPFNADQVRHRVARVLEEKRLGAENLSLRARLTRATAGERAFIAESAAMQELFATARAVAAADTSVLLAGPSGAGKEVVARFIHEQSSRAQAPLVTFNCAAIPPTLIDSELFGRETGGFTGAAPGRRGCFELANGGTLLLDEIAGMPMETQAKLLRALEDRKIRRVDGGEDVSLNVRILAATSQCLEDQVRAGRFREDVYWRLNVVQLRVPALRDRRADILPLARYFLEGFCRDQKKSVPGFSVEASEALRQYDWPGNVRELRNAVERAVIFAEPGTPLRLDHLPREMQTVLPGPPGSRTYRSLRDMELDYIKEVLASCGGNRVRAAEILGLSAVTLWRRLGPESASR